MAYPLEQAMTQYASLVKWWSRKYYFRGFSPEDLEQDFLVVLCNCCRLFDETRGIKFNTYLTTAIHWHVSQHLNHKSGKIQETELEDRFVVDGEFNDCFVFPQELNCGERIAADLLLCGYSVKDMKRMGVDEKYLRNLKRKWLKSGKEVIA